MASVACCHTFLPCNQEYLRQGVHGPESHERHSAIKSLFKSCRVYNRYLQNSTWSVMQQCRRVLYGSLGAVQRHGKRARNEPRLNAPGCLNILQQHMRKQFSETKTSVIFTHRFYRSRFSINITTQNLSESAKKLRRGRKVEGWGQKHAAGV